MRRTRLALCKAAVDAAESFANGGQSVRANAPKRQGAGIPEAAGPSVDGEVGQAGHVTVRVGCVKKRVAFLFGAARKQPDGGSGRRRRVSPAGVLCLQPKPQS